ncbi:tyrosine-type recombinase/integrase [Methylopila musalis]|uniref:Tyrosine-type recombinase/integrase n=1 Tax=Methylopila musalis TaxID=1134781 RepID=A0ABW3Z396_9HYPH
MKVDLTHVCSDVDRHGNVRYYVRIKGRPKVRLPLPVGGVEFMAVYGQATAGKPPPARASTRGTFRALCLMYYESAAFKGTDVSTQSWRRRALDRICREKDGGFWPAAAMDAYAVGELRDELANQPSVANTRLKALSALYKWAAAKKHVPANPVVGVARLKYASAGHHTWTLDEIETFRARHPLGTKARLAMELLFCTTGRREDAPRLGPQHLRRGRVVFTQAKNEHCAPIQVDIPIRPELAAAIAACPSGHLTFLVTEFGKPFTAAGFGNWFRERCDEAGLKHCSAHGLRKGMATWLADVGASEHEIMAVTGHQTLAEVERYTKRANRKRLATSAMERLNGGTLEQKSIAKQ